MNSQTRSVPVGVDNVVSAPRATWPGAIPHHPSILSSWEESVVRVRNARGVVRTIDLAAIPLPANRALGGPFDEGLTLDQFPHWVDTARAYLALSLNQHTGHMVLDLSVNRLNHVLRFFAWCVERRVYKLSALRPQDLNDLADALKPHGWFSALSISERLDRVVERARNDTSFLHSVVSVVGGNCYVSPEALSRDLGLWINCRELPFEFLDTMSKLAGVSSEHLRSSRNRKGWSQSSFKNCFMALNRLADLPETLDRLDFEPFPNAREHARQSGARPDGRTRNLAVEDAATLLGVALKWIYERSDGVIELVNVWRDALAEASRRSISPTVIQVVAAQRLREAYPKIQAKYGLPGNLAGPMKQGTIRGTTLVKLIQDVQTAAMIMVCMNHGRRKNEVLGEGTRPWGLYLGCLLSSDPFVDAYELDIYIEKTWREWMRMSTNKLTVDAIRVLERLRLAMFPHEQDCSDLPLSDLRRRKLFVFPSYRVLMGEKVPPIGYDFRNHSSSFFLETGLGEEARRTHIFRRFFALIYMYRWDHPSLQALSEHLCHFDLESTRVYITDPSFREQAERIETVYRGRADLFPFEELEEAQQQYADDLLEAMLTSTSAGGPMTRRVRHWVKRLARRIAFADNDLDVALAAVRSNLARRGYLPTPFRHGACWATGDRMARRARCGRDGKLHREQADIGICSACPFHSTSAAFLRNVEDEAMALETRAETAASGVEQDAHLTAANRLRELISLERELMTQYRPTPGFARTGPET